MVIKVIILVLVHLSIATIGILMGKYLPNMVDKNDKHQVFSFIYACLIPILNIMVVIIGLSELADIVLCKTVNYIKRWL